ncbi:MAG: M15 family metallopeptidase [Clostridia bacterium]|nr:M15 family metallopeptidase [Clostridia bacterium]
MKKFIVFLVGLIIVISCRMFLENNFNKLNKETGDLIENNITNEVIQEKKIDDWRIRLVNYENVLPDNYEIELKNIDSTRQFDARAIEELINMMTAMKKDGITNIWVQSSYRSITRQREIFDKKVNTYLLQGKTQEEAERLTLQTINKPGTSDHNLGLAIDFNYIDYAFDELKGFKWLQQNAEKYGFILRYRKDKEDITKVNYEPWHWRYVGVEHAKKINELDFCLEEYIDFLKEN